MLTYKSETLKAWDNRKDKAKEKINEQSIVDIVVYELQNNTELFFPFLMNQLGIAADNLEFKSVGISVVESERTTFEMVSIKLDNGEYLDKKVTVFGENDIVLLYRNKANGRESAVLIEVKADAFAQPEQPERYLARCKHYTKQLYQYMPSQYEVCSNLLIAPKGYYVCFDENKIYNNYLSTESIIDEYFGKIAKDDASSAEKANILKEAANRCIIYPDNFKAALPISLGYRAYLEFVKEKYPDTYELLSIESPYFRNDNGMAYFVNNEKTRTICYGNVNKKSKSKKAPCELSCHAMNGKFALVFENLNQEIYNELEQVLSNKLRQFGINAVIRHGKNEKSSFRLVCEISSDKYNFEDIYEFVNPNSGIANMTLEEIKCVKVKIKTNMLPVVEKGIDAVRKLHLIGNSIKMSEIEAIYSKYN